MKLNHQNIFLVVALMFSLSSCDSIYNFICCGCSEEDFALFVSVADDDLEALKTYLENGGDPEFKCFDGRGRGFGAWSHLYWKVEESSSVEMVQYYIGYDLPQNIKDEMLETFVGREEIELARLLVDVDAHISSVASNCLEEYWEKIQYEVLVSVGYDFNWQDDNGNTLLMLHAKCRADDTSDELIAILQFLIEHGASTNIKNDNGKTAYDIAVNPKVKAFLAQFRSKK